MAHKSPKPRNEHAAALHHRAGNAGAAVAIDTRPKTIPNKRGRTSRRAARVALLREAF